MGRFAPVRTVEARSATYRRLRKCKPGQTLCGELTEPKGREFKVVYNSSSLAGQLAAVEGGLAIAAITQCTVQASLQVLGSEHGMGRIEPMEVSILRSRASRGSEAVDSLHAFIISSLRQQA